MRPIYIFRLTETFHELFCTPNGDPPLKNTISIHENCANSKKKITGSGKKKQEMRKRVQRAISNENKIKSKGHFSRHKLTIFTISTSHKIKRNAREGKMLKFAS